MYYVYIIQSQKDSNIYIGFTNDLEKRFQQHNSGSVRSTKSRIPFVMLYYEALNSKIEAVEREKYFKSGCGRSSMKRLLKHVGFV